MTEERTRSQHPTDPPTPSQFERLVEAMVASLTAQVGKREIVERGYPDGRVYINALVDPVATVRAVLTELRTTGMTVDLMEQLKASGVDTADALTIWEAGHDAILTEGENERPVGKSVGKPPSP